jgi:hypothetical protein
MTPEHPGTIELVDAEGTRVVAASEIEEAIRFVPGADGTLQPVTRITILTLGDRREISQFGADGTLLRSTYQTVDER